MIHHIGDAKEDEGRGGRKDPKLEGPREGGKNTPTTALSWAEYILFLCISYALIFYILAVSCSYTLF